MALDEANKDAMGNYNCYPEDNLTAALELISSSNNEITNILHTRSPSAITVRLSGLCNYNSILPITLEQEGKICQSWGHTGLFIDDLEIEGNLIITNFNNGVVRVPSAAKDSIMNLCIKNIIETPNLVNCNTATSVAQPGCPE